MNTPASVNSATLLLALALSVAGCAAPQSPPPETIALGRDKVQGPCTAKRYWKDQAVEDAFGWSYAVTCNRSAVTRPQAALRLVPDTPRNIAVLDKHLVCGKAVDVQTAAGPARLSECRDLALDARTMRLDVQLGKRRLVASTSEALLGPVEQGMAFLAGKRAADWDASKDTATGVTLRYADLPDPEQGAERAAVDDGFDPAVALTRGVGLNRRGLHADASRVLNQALSYPADESQPALRVNLLLEAGLADSNISFVNSAAAHFREAAALMRGVPETDADFLKRKQATYEALDKINRRQFSSALGALNGGDQPAASDTPATSALPLRNLVTMRELNRGAVDSRDPSRAVAVPNAAELNGLLLDSQGNWARSVALLARGDLAGANAALTRAIAAYNELYANRVEPGAVLWLGARLERQRARLAVRVAERNTAETAAWDEARASFEASLAMLRRNAALSAGTATEPVIAETQLEYASALAGRAGASFGEVRADYRRAVQAVIASRDTATQLPSGIERYFDGLIAESAAPAEDTYEAFFEAMQATGEPAVARQMSQLKDTVSNDSEIAQALRDREDAENEIRSLNESIRKAGDAERETLVRQLKAQTGRLDAANAALSNDPGYRAVNDRPATVKEVRERLGEREAFLKIVALNDRIFGMLITRKAAHIYAVAASAADRRQVDGWAGAVRESIDGKLIEQHKIFPFDAANAARLFDRIAGPEAARSALLDSTALVIDPSGPLEKLPVGVLVTSTSPIDPLARPRDRYDNSQTAFLARRMTISTAVSPRSFLAVRGVDTSRATRAFLGLGDHRPDAVAGVPATVSVGLACNASYADLVSLSQRIGPISAHELSIAAEALGVNQPGLATQDQFTDQAIIQRGRANGDLRQYQVLHFATHGLEEGQWGCGASPPALVTSFGGKGSDGLLSFNEIAKLRLDANLVFLSACDTAAGVRNDALARASGREEAGATLEGLVRAFLAANARAVLATYWAVPVGEESDDLIDAFYRSARNGTIGGGLQDAQVKLMRTAAYSHPYYWGAYFVVGDSAKPLLTGEARKQIAAR